jgi:putative tricarboxylic transport membrane protein
VNPEPASPGKGSDLAQGLFWLAVGGSIFYASWTMDRLENLGVKPFSAPGLLPGVLGIFIFVLGLAMLLRSFRASTPAATPSIEWRRILWPLALCLGFACGLVGRGLPFWASAWLFIAVMIWTLQYAERKAKGELIRLAIVAVTVGGAASVVISLVFQELFLIRLP